MQCAPRLRPSTNRRADPTPSNNKSPRRHDDNEGSLLRRPPEYIKRRDVGSEATLRQRNSARTCLLPGSQRRRC